MIFGILSGLFCALLQSISYLTTRNYVQSRPAALSPSRQLLVLGHLWMALFGWILLIFSYPAAGIPWNTFALPMLGNLTLYTCGQLALVTALKHAEASRVSPLMTSKLILSSILVMLYGQPVGNAATGITLLQWFAVALCIVAGISLNRIGGVMKSRAVFAIALAAASFSISDWFINKSIAALLASGIDGTHASLLTQGVTYISMGFVAIPLLIPYGSRKPRDWLDAAPFAFTWFIAMIGLFAAFASVGILLGSILQCTRGFITILLGALIMRLGHHHIEPLAPRRVIIRRLAAGILMFIGITLYVIRDPAKLKIGASPHHASTAAALGIEDARIR